MRLCTLAERYEQIDTVSSIVPLDVMRSKWILSLSVFSFVLWPITTGCTFAFCIAWLLFTEIARSVFSKRIMAQHLNLFDNSFKATVIWRNAENTITSILLPDCNVCMQTVYMRPSCPCMHLFSVCMPFFFLAKWQHNAPAERERKKMVKINWKWKPKIKCMTQMWIKLLHSQSVFGRQLVDRVRALFSKCQHPISCFVFYFVL